MIQLILICLICLLFGYYLQCKNVYNKVDSLYTLFETVFMTCIYCLFIIFLTKGWFLFYVEIYTTGKLFCISSVCQVFITCLTSYYLSSPFILHYITYESETIVHALSKYPNPLSIIEFHWIFFLKKRLQW